MGRGTWQATLPWVYKTVEHDLVTKQQVSYMLFAYQNATLYYVLITKVTRFIFLLGHLTQ